MMSQEKSMNLKNDIRDLNYQSFVRARIEIGLAEVKNGNTVTIEAVVKKFLSSGR